MNTNASGETETSSGGQENNQQLENGSIETEVTQDKVNYSTYQKVLSEKKKKDLELKELREYRAKVEAAAKQAEEQKMAEKGEFQKLLEERNKQVEELSSKLTQKEKMFQDAVKFSAFKKALPGSIEDQFLPLVDLDKIALDESGQPDKSSIERYAKEFTKTYGRVLTTQSGVRIPQDGARGSEKSLSYEEWLKLPAKEMRARYKDIKSNTRRD